MALTREEVQALSDMHNNNMQHFKTAFEQLNQAGNLIRELAERNIAVEKRLLELEGTVAEMILLK